MPFIQPLYILPFLYVNGIIDICRKLLNLCSICAADFGEDNDLSTSKKLQKCSVAKKEVEEHLVEYCTLREYGFNFEN